MDIKQFKKDSYRLPINTNNGWGFGGKIGTHYTLIVGDIEYSMFVGKFYYRHTGSSSANTWSIGGTYVSKKEFEQAIEKL